MQIGIRTLNDYCAGRVPIPRKKLEELAEFLEYPISSLVGEDAASMVNYQQSTLTQGNSEMDKKRRDLLYLLSAAGGSLILPLDLDWQRIEDVVSMPACLDMAAIQDLEVINSKYWSVYRSASSKSSVLDGVAGQLKTLVQFLKEPHTSTVHKQLCTLICDLSQLAGEIFFDADDYPTAQACYTFAAAAAKEAGHYDLWACALIRHAFLPIYEQQFPDAHPLLQEAQRLSSRGDTKLATRFWASAVMAEVHAGTGNLSDCQVALDSAQEVLRVEGGTNGAWLRFDGSRLPEQRGACFVHLHQPDLAEPALKEALIHLSSPTRRRGLVLTDLAIASVQGEQVEQACTYAGEVVDIALQGSSGVLKKRLYLLRTQLEPFATSGAVKELDQRLALLP